MLVNISDESVMWVEAQTVPSALPEFEEGARVRVGLDRVVWLEDGTEFHAEEIDAGPTVGGLFTSTLLPLVPLPVIYEWIESKSDSVLQ